MLPVIALSWPPIRPLAFFSHALTGLLQYSGRNSDSSFYFSEIFFFGH